MNDLIKVISRRIDGGIKRTWDAELIRLTGSNIVLDGRFASDVEHPDLGLIRKGTISIEYYWTDRWYNIFAFYQPDGIFRNFYCNINQPPLFNTKTLDYIDMEIDLFIDKDLSSRILDLDEYEAAKKKYAIKPEIDAEVFRAVSELETMLSKGEAPFDNIQPYSTLDL